MPNELFFSLLLTRRRLRVEEVVAHPKRRALLALVGDRPGISVGEARASLQIALGTFYHHVAMLRRNGLLEAYWGRGRCTLYLPGVSDRRDADARALLRGAAIRLAAVHIAKHPGGSVADVSKATGRPTRTTYHHVQRLIEEGLVESRSPMRRFDLRATPRLERILGETR